MAVTTREEFKQYCLRALGAPVIEINVDNDQVEDRIDEALKYYADYHFDGSSKIYLKHQVIANNHPTAIHHLTVANAGTGYTNSDTVVITGGNSAAATIVTDGNGAITSVLLSNNGTDFAVSPTVTVSSNTGSGGSITGELGGYIDIPNPLIGITRILPLGTAIGGRGMFSLQYQIALNDLWNLSNYDVIPYYIARAHLSLLEQLFVGQKPLRFNRHMNRLYVDMDWDTVALGHYLIVEAYQSVDPDTYTDVWNDRWLLHYTTALIKRQWGANLKKFSGMVLPGGIMFNGQQIFNEAMAEISTLENEMLYSYSLPSADMIG